MNKTNFGAIYVEEDDPRFLEENFDAGDAVVDLATQDAASLLKAYRTRDMNFDTAPFDEAGGRVRFFPGGYSVWSGFPGAGKTTLLRQLVCHLIQRKRKVFVASMEQNPMDYFNDLAVVAHAKCDLNEDNVQWCLDAWAGSLYLFSHKRGIASHAKLFAIIAALAAQGVRHAILDSFMALDINSQDWEGQRQFAVNLANLCERTGVHVHLVAHPKKPQRNGDDPDISDVAGASDLGRFADNVFFVKRGDSDIMTADVTGMQVSVRKQRYNQGLVGKIDGFFHRNFRQYQTTEYASTPTRYLPNGAYGQLWYDQEGT